MDYFCSFDGLVALGVGVLIHAGRIYSLAPGSRNRDRTDPRHTRQAAHLDEQQLERFCRGDNHCPGIFHSYFRI